MIHVAADRLREAVEQVFVGAGVPGSAAQQVARSLVEANLVGHDSHGVLRVESYVTAVETGRVDPRGEPTISRESATKAVLDGGRNFGQVVAHRAMELAISKAREHDVGILVVHNCGHTGRLGEYVVRAAEAGCMGLVFGSGSRKGGAVAPYLGTSAVFNTNPIAWGVPAGVHPPVFMDYATSVVSGGKLMAAQDKGTAIPEGWLLDGDGFPTTDPAERERGGVLLPFGKHKGYGLSFMIEALSGGLAGTGCAVSPGYESGFVLVMMAVNIAAFQPLDKFCQTVNDLIAATKAARKAPGVEEVLVPGEPEWSTRETRLRHGLDLPDTTWQRIVDVGAGYNVVVSL